MPLHEGWNMIGDPQPYAVPFNGLTVEMSSGEQVPIAQAVDKGLMLPFIYNFDGTDYSFSQLPGGNLRPWEGHWVYVIPRTSGLSSANKTLTLIIPPLRALNGRAANKPTTTSIPTVSGPGSWAMRLEARANDLVDGNNFIGMTSKATDGDDHTKVPKPPKPSPYVSLGISRPDSQIGVGIYSQDMRPTGGLKTWNVVVNTDQSQSDVTLAWPDIKRVPKNYRLTLTDKVTGQAIDLRQQSSYKFNTGRSAEPRAFTLSARPTGLAGRAVISNLFVNPRRSGDGRSASLYEVGYTISQDAKVEVTVLGYNGRLLATIGNTRAVNTGDNRVVWNGRDGAGRLLPSGTYVVQVRAITTEGDVTRTVLPLVMNR